MQVDNKEDPFSNLVTVDWSFLEDCSSRTKCIKCNKSRKYYCYSCCIALPHIQDKIPKVKLPVKVDIIKHPKELDGKSTAPHASILAPDDVTIHIFPCIPDYDGEKVIIVFPGEGSVGLEELSMTESDPDAFSTRTEHQEINWCKDNGENGEMNEFSNNACGPIAKKDSVKVKGNSNDNNNSTDKNSESVSDDVSYRVSSSCEDQPLNALDNGLQTSHSDSLKYYDRKRKSSNEQNNSNEESADHANRCTEPTASATKHQKTHLKHCPFEKVVFVDCTWNQTKQIVNDERLKGLKKVELKSQCTHFWRSQDGMPKTYLSTIEAIYFFFKDFHSIFVDPVYRNEYDNLLMFFCFMYHKIKQTAALECS